MSQPSTSHVFISYSRKDTDVMRRIVTHLRGQGITAWVDNEKLVPGTPIWEGEIEKAIKGAFAIVVVLSPDAKESVWVLNELTLADEYKKRVFPVLVQGDFRDSIPFRLVTRQFVDLRKDEHIGIESLSIAISRYLEELERLEEERQAAEKEAERLRREREIAVQTAREAEEKRLAAQKAEARRLLDERTREAEQQEKGKAELFAAQKAEEERVAKVQAEAERQEKERTERLTAQKAEEARTAKEKLEKELAAKVEAERIAARKAKAEPKAEEKAISVEAASVAMKAETVLTAPAQKKPFSKGLVIGIVGVAALVVLGIGVWGISSYLTELVTPAPTKEPASESPISTAPVTTGSPATELPPAIEATVGTSYECTDPLGCVIIAPDEPVHIAYWGVLSGADASLGEDSKRGVEIAIDDKGGKLFGHDILLTTEDAGCNPEGGATAAAKLASDTSLVGLIGSSCSDETVGGIAAITNAGLTTISPSNTRPALTNPDRGPDYAGYLRTSQNDAFQGKVVAEFAYNFLGVRKAATLHDGSAYAQALQQVFADEFTKLGGTIVIQEAVAKDATDMRPVLTTIAAADPELLYYPVFVALGGYVTAQIRDVAGLENVYLVGSDGIFTADLLKGGGKNTKGMYLSSPDFSLFTGDYVGFIAKHTAKYGGSILSIFHAHAYDATNILFAALGKAAVVEADGTIYVPRQALRNAIFATKDFKGITGTLTCSPSGDCGAPVIAVYEIMNSDPASWNPSGPTNPNPKKIYP